MLKNYLKIGFKVLLRRKFYTFISLFGVSFTLVVLMVSASLFDHIFGPFPPETKADRTLGLYLIEARGKNNNSSSLPGYMFLDRYVRTMKTPELVSVHSMPKSVMSFQNGVLIESYLKYTDGVFWRILDFHFLEGGPFTGADERNRNFVAVINDATRQKFFGRQSALGKYVEADGQRYRVVGVVSNVPYFRLNSFADIWVPISTNKTDDYKKQYFGGFLALILARKPADRPKIQAEFQALLPGVENPDPRRFNVVRGVPDELIGMLAKIFIDHRVDVVGNTRKLMAWLAGFAVLFMLLPAINLTNINVSRIIERASEIGVRKAFGATSRALVGQFIAENVMLTLIGGALGWVFSLLVLRGLEATELVRYAQFNMNYRVFAAGFAMTLFFGVFSGVYPAWKMSRLHPVEALKGGSL